VNTSRKVLLAGTSLLTVAIGLSEPKSALADQVVSGSQAGLTWSTGNVSITATGTVLAITTGIAAVLVGSSVSVGTLTNSGKISGGTSSSNVRGVSNGGSIAALTNSGFINGGAVWGSGGTSGAAVYNSGSIGSLTNTGTISGSSGPAVYNSGSIATLSNSGTISGGTNNGISNSGSIAVLSNTGTITGGAGGVVYNTGSIGSLSNSGTITGAQNNAIGVKNFGSITNLTNTGTIGLLSTGTQTVTNGHTGTAVGTFGAATGIFNVGNIATLTNSGAINGSVTAIYNGTSTLTINGATTTYAGVISSLNNSGNLVSNKYGINNTSTIGSLTNSGSISGTGASGIGIVNSSTGTISALNNSNGVISGGQSGVANTGGIGTLTNSGSISGANYGVYNSQPVSSSTIGTLGTTIASTISNVPSKGSITALVNSGNINATGSTSNGTSISGTGLGNDVGATIGSLTNTSSGSISGNIGISNSGAINTLVNNGVIGGGSGGSIGISDYGTIGALNNSGTINGSNAAILNSLTTISSAVGSTISTTTYTGSISSINNSGVIGGGSIGVSNYVSIGSLSNTGTISGSSYAILNGVTTVGSASGTGSIGLITNSGVIAGNIENDTANSLTIAGGSGSSFGTLTGYSAGSAGSIVSTASNLVFSSGNILLNDDINATGQTVLNRGATIQLTSTRTITGNYTQTGGGLVIPTTNNGTTYGSLTVNGNAVVNNSTITISGSGLKVGETFTVVSPTGTGSYANDTSTITGTGGLISNITSSGNNLVVSLDHINYAAIASQASGAGGGMGPALNAIASLNTPAAIAFQNTYLAPLYNLPAAQQAAAIKQLAPIQMTPSAQAASLAAAPTSSAIEQHVSAPSGGGDTGASSGSAGHNYGLWGQVLGGEALRNTTSSADGYRSRDFGLITGLDTLLDADTTVGSALSWVRGWSSGLAGSTGSFAMIDSYQLTGYGQHRWGPAFTDGQLGFGYNSFSQRREIGYANTAAHASYGGEQYLASVRVGYDLSTGDGITYTPLAKVRYLRAVSDSYTENGAGTGNLFVNRHGVQSITQDIGSKMSWNANSDWGALKPEITLAWVHDYKQAPILTLGSFAAFGSPYSSPVAQPAADGAKLNAAVTLETAGDVSFRVEYEGEVRHDYESHAGMLKATLGF
jgi:uncharacterized protein with beta-barrel porin domain